MKLAIGESAGFARLAFPNDGRFVCPTICEVPIDAVFTDVDLPTDEPFRVGSFPIENFAPFLLPSKFLCLTRPEGGGLID